MMDMKMASQSLEKPESDSEEESSSSKNSFFLSKELLGDTIPKKGAKIVLHVMGEPDDEGDVEVMLGSSMKGMKKPMMEDLKDTMDSADQMS